MQLLSKVATCLRKSGLTINVEKSKFCQKEIKYLGYIVGDGCVKTDPGKVSAILDFPVPKTVKQIRRFLGMTGWYRRFIRDYAALAAPVSDCLKKTTKFEWTAEAQSAFEKLKEAMTFAPVLKNPDFTKEFFVQCDASKLGVGGVLFQVSDEGDEYPISFVSQKLNKAQRNYSITELECLAAVLCIKKFRPYVEGFKFTVITDHASLKWLMSQTDLSGRLARWSLKLQSYDFTTQHRKGSANVVADTLSRAFVESLSEDLSSSEINLDSDSFKDEEYLQLVKFVSDNQKQLPDLKIQNGMVFKRVKFRREKTDSEDSLWRIWVPASLRIPLVEAVHRSVLTCHGGVNVVYHQLSQKYYWPNMIKTIRDTLSICDSCKEIKSPNHCLKPPMGARFISERPFQRLYTDLLGPYPRTKNGNSQLLIVLDHFSKFVFLKPLKHATSISIIDYFEHEIFPIFGVCEYLHSDNGKQYVSKEFQSFLSSLGVKHIRTPLYTPQANASERVNRVILDCIRSFVRDNQTAWDRNIHHIAGSLRSRIHQAIERSPYQVVFGFHMIRHASTYRILKELGAVMDDVTLDLPDPVKVQHIRNQVAVNLQKAHERAQGSYNLRTTVTRFRPGQEVYRRNFTLSDFKKAYNAKLAPKFVKCRVAKEIGQNQYELEDLKGNNIGIFHAKDLRA